MTEYTITLTKEQLDIVLAALGEIPLKFSGPVFQVIQTQMNKVDNG